MSRSNYGKKQRWRQQLPELAELAAWERPTIATPEDVLIEREEADQLYRAATDLAPDAGVMWAEGATQNISELLGK